MYMFLKKIYRKLFIFNLVIYFDILYVLGILSLHVIISSGLVWTVNMSEIFTCASCKQLIKDKAMKAKDNFYHQHHFVCSQEDCNLSLLKLPVYTRFVIKTKDEQYILKVLLFSILLMQIGFYQLFSETRHCSVKNIIKRSFWQYAANVKNILLG